MTPNDFFLSIGINFLTGCTQQLASQLDANVAAAGVDAEKWYQRSKDLQTRVIESFSDAARRLISVPRNPDALSTILSDQVFIGEVASALIAGELEPERFAAEIAQRDSTIETPAAIKEIAVALIEAFNAVIASDPELSALVSLRRSEELKRNLQNVSTGVEEIKRGVMDLQVRTPPDDQLADITREIRSLPAAVVEALRRVGTGPLALESPADARLAESVKRRFENALNELKTGSVAIAAQEFRTLLPDLSADRPEEKTLLFRTTANLGIALYYLGETKAAEEHFDRALELNPDSVRAKANKVLACLSRHDYVAAKGFLEDALSSEPRDLDLIKFKAQLLADEGNVHEAIEFLQQHQVEHEDYFVSLAIHHNQAAEYDKGAEAARKALELNSNSEGGMAVLADALAMPIIFRKAHEKLPIFALAVPESEALRKAVELGEKAIAILRRNKRKVALVQLLINFSAYCAAAGDFTRAASAAEEAAILLPGDSAPLTNLYMAQMHLEQFTEAAKTARALSEVEPPEVATMREMDALMAQQEFPAAIELYTTKISQVPALQNQPHAICLYAAALFRSLETEAAIEQLDNAKRRFPNHPLVLLEEAHVREDLHEFDRAEASFKSATKHATGEYAFHAKQQLGLFYYRRENWAEAEKHLLGGIHDPLQSPLIVRYLICLYQLERFPKCLELAQQLIKHGPFQETVWELATNCYLRFNDLQLAERLLEELVRHSADLRHWLKLFNVTYRLHDVDRARKVLQRARAKHPDSFEVLVNLSAVEFATRHYRSAFELAVRAVEIKPDDLEGHRAIVRSGLFAPDSLKFSDAEKKQIQASIAHLAGQEGSGLKPMDLSDDLSNLREVLRQASETVGQAEQLFSSKGLPMAFLSKVIGRSPFQIWSGLTSHQQLFVRMAYGSTQEQETEGKLAMAAEEVVVDISTLFTLKMLNMLPLLPRVFKKVSVATATFESIRAEVEETTAFKPPQSILGYQKGQIVLADVPPETYEARKAFVTDLLTFLKSDAVLLSGIQGTVWDDAAVRNTIKILGQEFGHSVAIAKGRSIPLYSDDVGLRTLAKNEHEVTGFCTQAFLRAAVTKGVLTVEEYDDALLELFLHNYNFVSESADTVIRALRKDKYALTPLTKRLVSRVIEPGITRAVTAGILGHVLADIWLHAGGALREQWLDLTAQNLSRSEEFPDVCAVLFRTVAVSLIRLPAAFFGLIQGIGRSTHFSVEQIKIWKFLQRMTSKTVEKACAVLASTEPNLKSEWHQNIRASETLL